MFISFYPPTMAPKLIYILLIIYCISCSNGTHKKFAEVPPSHSHITFKNQIKEDVEFNILNYEYLYNGGGVATGDLNNDGLTDIVFTGNMVSNKVYLNKGNLQFDDITDKAGLKGRQRWKTGVVMADVNGDGLLDIYVCYSGPGTDEERANELYINNGIKNGLPSFSEEAKKYGLDAVGTYSTTASFFDMDNDGDLDMFLVNHADMFYNPFFNTDKLESARHPKFGNRLYRNDNGFFTDISEKANIKGSGLNFGLSVANSDVNNDGWTDIYVTNDYDESDFLYLNNKNGTFSEVLSKAAGHTSEFAMGSDIADYNNDGNPDVVVLDMLPEDNYRQKLLKGADSYDKYTLRVDKGFQHQQMRNTLQLNNGNNTNGIPVFSEVGQMAGIYKTDWSWAPLLADFDNDGWKDLFITNGIFKDITNLDFVKYTSGYSSNFIDKKGDKVEMWKLIQQMPSTKLNNYLFRNNQNLSFSDVSADWGLNKKAVSNGGAYADLDNDGDLDLVINCLNDDATIYENNTVSNNSSHFLQIKLKGEGKNTLGIGAKVSVKTAHTDQMMEQFITRGFQSSVDPVMHFGFGKDNSIQSITVKWPGGKISHIDNIKSDTLITINQQSASIENADTTSKLRPLFEDITKTSGIDFTHHQSSYVDFKTFPLLPYQVSKIGPSLAKGDVNGDGLDDLFIGASAEQQGKLYLQTKSGHFVASQNQPWNNENNCTIADALFFDADNDGDEDLYVVSGGADYYLNSKNYQDKIYENDGKGNFRLIASALPAETISGGCVRAADIDKDGLTDVFVGGKLSPGIFPKAPFSLVLKNKSTKNHLQFVKDETQTDTLLAKPGLVQDGVWIDLNKDSWPDLILVGMFMPITVFENNHGRLINKTKEYNLQDTQGWWCRILAGDFDNGDTDLVLGNLGTNTQFKASPREPVSITYADFNGDGVIDPILCSYNNGTSYPYFSRDEILEQIPSLQKRFGRYSDYANAQLKDMFTEDQLSKAATVEIKTTQSVYLQNNGNRKFSINPLPPYAQMSMINGMVSEDVDKDGNKDVILAGNFYPFRVQMGPLDAGIGLILKGNGKGKFTPLSYTRDNLNISGDVRNLVELKGDKQKFLVVAKNNEAIQVLKLVTR